MEEKKNNQVQALDDDILEDVAGGATAMYTLKNEFLGWFFSDAEIKKLKDCGWPVRKNSKGYYDIISADAYGNEKVLDYSSGNKALSALFSDPFHSL